MNTWKAALAAASILLLAGAGSSSAQLVNHERLQPGDSQLYLQTGLSPSLVTSLGYVRVLKAAGRSLSLSGELGLGTAEADLADYRGRIGLETRLLDAGGLGLAVRARGEVKGTRNDIYEAVAVGADFTGFAGLYRESWILLAEGTFDRTFATRLVHSDWYRRNFYAAARDGWYGGTAGTWYVGLATQKSFGRLDLSLRLGRRWSAGGEALDPPFVGGLGLGWRF